MAHLVVNACASQAVGVNLLEAWRAPLCGFDPPSLGSGTEAVTVDVLHLDGQVEGLGGSVVQGRPDAAYGLKTPNRQQAVSKAPAVYSPASTEHCNTTVLSGR